MPSRTNQIARVEELDSSLELVSPISSSIGMTPARAVYGRNVKEFSDELDLELGRVKLRAFGDALE